MERLKRGDDWLALVAVAAFTGLVSFAVATNLTLRRPIPGESADVQPFRARYGPDHYSQGVEEWLIRDYFKDRTGGVFLDVGANHYRDHSTTYYLEHHLGWSGIAVEAQVEFAEDYARFRPRTRFVAMFAGDADGGTVEFYIPQQPRGLNASAHRENAPGPVETRAIATTTLTTVLDRAGIARLDFLSMDIEDSEPAALRGFDIGRFRPALVCIEDHLTVREDLLRYFTEHDYRIVAAYLRADPINLYFEPRPITSTDPHGAGQSPRLR
jgi:FkbM family methyltransferase